MTSHSDAKKIAPHWLMRLFGAEAATFVLDENGLQVTTRGGERYLILSESLASEAVLEEGMFLSRLVLQTNLGPKVFSGLRKQDANALFGWLREHWLKELAPDVVQAAATVRQMLEHRYPRTSRVSAAIHLAHAAKLRFRRVPEPQWCTHLSEDEVAAFGYLNDVSSWDETAIEGLRASYVSQQLERYTRFFDQVESKPLTEKQREACVIDEDNNLVLAGAGTGKTSTMIGRAGYLLESGQARAEEILLLAFANKAAAEMQERSQRRLGDAGLSVSTFHKLGKEIIATVEGQQPALTALAEDDRALASHVNTWFESHLQVPAYRQLVLKYFRDHLYPDANPFDFESEGDYYEYITANEIRTLKGELVKSLGECLVANHLFSLGIEYQYEPAYQHKTASALYRQYQPDFYLPEHGIYIEYYGIDRQGNTAPYVDRELYHQGIAWKRGLHQQHQTPLLELFHYEKQEGTLFESLERQLIAHGVEFQALSPEAMLATLREFGAISSFASLLADLLKRYRANCYEEGGIEQAIARASNAAQVDAAMKLLKPIMDDYEHLLVRNGQIDFDDMIGKAISYVRGGKFRSPWRFILVDEFQDISDARARLITSLRDSVRDCSLFCVGDDWQAIYRFAGSDLRFTTAFSVAFGCTKVTALDLTFRFNSGISDVASRFVLQNPEQIRKQLNTLRTERLPTVSLMREDNRKRSSVAEPDRLERVIERIAAIARPGSSVFLLGRYSFILPDQADCKRLSSRFPSLKLERYTIHACKGKEADYVVILGMESGKHGFPSQKITHPLLEALLPEKETFDHAEERRLFYVALTRARQRAYLIADMAVASSFVVELLREQYPVELGEFEASLTQQLFHLLKCGTCKTGTLVPRKSQYGAFFGCNKFPLCTHRERGCQRCGSQMRREGRFKICINADCLNWVPTCPRCKAEMVRRKGRYGEFWGCRNYRATEGGCSHTEQSIDIDRRLLTPPAITSNRLPQQPA